MAKELLTQQDIQREFSVGKATLWRLVQDGRVTRHRLTGGRKVLYRREEIERLFQPVPMPGADR